MNLHLSTRLFRLDLTTDVEPEKHNEPRMEAKDGGLFEVDGQPDARELFSPRLPEPKPMGFGTHQGFQRLKEAQ